VGASKKGYGELEAKQSGEKDGFDDRQGATSQRAAPLVSGRGEAYLSGLLDQLYRLQDRIRFVQARQKDRDTVPEDLSDIDREHRERVEAVQRIRERLVEAEAERRHAEGELADFQEKQKKYQGQLMQVKNQQQYAAAWKEIDATRKHVKELEDSALKTIGDIDGLQAQLDERQEGHDALKKRWDDAYAAWQHSLADLRGEVAALEKKAATIEERVPDALKREFYRIFKGRQNTAVAVVISDSCSICRSRVRPMLQQQLKRGELVHCEGCHRILYLERPPS